MKIQKKEKEFIFKDNQSFNSCHASTLISLPGGDVFSAWFGGSEEGAEDVAIWGARRKNGQWNSPVKLADKKGIPHWNPVLFRGIVGKIFLFYKIGHNIPSWETKVIKSQDGTSWSKPESLIKNDQGGRGPVKNKPIVLQNGTWLAPASIETENLWKAFVDISNDQGQSWEKSETVPLDYNTINGKGVIQPTLWESRPGKVHMLLRSTEGYIYRSDSEDGGRTWSKAYPTELPNNNSGIDLTKLKNGNLILAYNPISENWGPRTPLVLAVSVDNGETWDKILTLEEGEGEYSYPAIISQDNEVYITYTWQRERIVFWNILLA